MKRSNGEAVPSNQQLLKELQRTVQKKHHWKVIRITFEFVFLVTALLVLTTAIGFSLHHVPEENAVSERIVVSRSADILNAGDVVVLHNDNETHLRRVIGVSGEWILIDDRGMLTAQSELPDGQEAAKVLNATEITYPYLVPVDSYFVTGDDGMSSACCVTEEMVSGKALFCIWPLEHFGFVE